MSKLGSLPLYAVVSAVLCSVAVAQSAAPAVRPAVRPDVRIVQPIDESNLVTLRGNTPPAANALNDRGAVSASLPMSDLILVLSRSSAQQAAFDAFVASQSDPSSPNYHQWLTPQQVGELYGPSTTDIATISNWLASRGFTVTEVTNDRMSIRFSGNAGLVESAFHTQIHNLMVNGKAHIGNMSDPQIPAALSPVVVGVKNIHNFFPRPQHHMGKTVERDPQSGRWMRLPSNSAQNISTSARPLIGAATPALKAKPQFGISVPASSTTSAYLVEDVSPWDFATIYNVAPAWSAGIDGTGQTIAIAGTSAIDLGSSTIAGSNGYNDVANFRSFFDLPTSNSWNTPIQISGNSQPLTVCSSTTDTVPFASNPCNIDSGDLVENSLDVEWSGAVAKNAQIILVSSFPASDTDDTLFDSESYIVNNLTARIMNVSYGECELEEGTGGNVEYYNLWETAASEGISVFVAAGDSGSASCDQGEDATYGNPYVAQFGLTVSGLASTPFNTAVGGTDFNWCPLLTAVGGPTNYPNGTAECSPGSYWNSTTNTTTESTAKGYVPEIPWNETCTSPLVLTYLEEEYAYYGSTPYQAINGTNYAVTDAETGCNWLSYYAGSLDQDGDGSYVLVDTVGGSGGASSCVANSTDPASSTFGSCTTGTTSTGTSTDPDTGLAQGSLTITAADGWPKPTWQTGVTGIPGDGVRDIPDVSFFASDGEVSSSSYLICVSADSNGYGGSTPCTYSNSTEPFAQEVGGTSVASPSMAGVMALINQKAGAAQGLANPGLYSLAAKQTYGSTCSAENATTSDGCYFNDIDQGTNAMPCNTGGSDNIVFGDEYDPYAPYYYEQASPNCTPVHAGDYAGILTGYNATTGYDEATGLGSLNVANVVTNAPSGVWVAASTTNTTTVTVMPSPSTTPVGVSLPVTVSVTGTYTSAPTGTIALVGDGYAATETIGTSPCTSNTNCTFTIPANTLGIGTNLSLTAYYYGDSNYGESNGTAKITVTTTPYFLSATTPAAVNPSATATSTATSTITGSSSPGYTGTVTLSTCVITSEPSNPVSVPTCALSSGTITFTNGTPSGSATATVTTYAATTTTSALTYPTPGNGKGFGRELLGAGGGTFLAFLVFLGVPARRRSWRAMLGMVVLLVTLGSLAGCGGGGTSNSGGTTTTTPATTAGAYTFTVSGTGNDADKTVESTTFTVTVN